MPSRKKLALEFFELAVSFAFVVFIFRFFDLVFGSNPGSPSLTLQYAVNLLEWTGYLVVMVTVVASYFWIVSMVNRGAWKKISLMLGFESGESPPAQGTLRGILKPDETLKCPKCGNTGSFRHQQLVELRLIKGITILGRDLGFVSRKPADQWWCEKDGHTFYRLLEE